MNEWCRKFFHPVVLSRWSSSVSHGWGMWCIWSDELVWVGLSQFTTVHISLAVACSLPPAPFGSHRTGFWLVFGRRAGDCPGPLGSASGGTGRASQTQTKKQARSVCHWRLLYKHRNTGHVESWETSRAAVLVNTLLGVYIEWDELSLSLNKLTWTAVL